MERKIAHRAEDGRVEIIEKHLQETSKLAREFAGAFHAEGLGERCGALHDVGKYSDAFQRRINEDGPAVDHSTAGAKEAWKMGDVSSAFCIAGHHGGLPNGGNRAFDTEDMSTMFGRLSKKIEDYSDGREWINGVNKPVVLPDYAGKDGWNTSFFIRMLYSCLVDADFLATESFMKDGSVKREKGESLSGLLKNLESYVATWKKDDTDLNWCRNMVRLACMDAGTTKPAGLYSLTVPTGGGKTISSLEFALHHAIKNGKERVIYVIPYTSIIEQTAGVFRDAVGAENVLEHHCNAGRDLYTETEWTEEQVRDSLATENWDAPLIVTTSVQFFESLFANKSSRCRKLHNIANSVIIFDEAQMLPINYLEPCVAAIAELVNHYSCSALLCTATQPSLNSLFAKYSNRKEIEEICPDLSAWNRCFQRVTFELLGCLKNDELTDRLMRQEQVLCIVNSKKLAHELFETLTGEGNYHLSTFMVADHRDVILKEIRERLEKNLPCRVISTSLIEAGVDVDFPTVYREEAGLDSILQAAGRCNREGKALANQSVVYVFQSENSTPKMFAQNVAATQYVLRECEIFSRPEAIKKYFDFLHMIKSGSLDQHGIIDMCRNGYEGGILPFEEIANQFHLIENETVTVYIPWRKGADFVHRYVNGQRSRNLMRALGRYGVPVYPQQFKVLYDSGAVEKTGDTEAVLLNMELYDERKGLKIEDGGGKAIFIGC